MAEKKRRDLEEAMDPRLRPAQMTLADARTELSNAVYMSTELLERLEGAGLVSTNAHHLRQEVARLAVDLLERFWTGPDKSS